MMTGTVYFAAGCFWGVEQFFSTISGVCDTEVGYIGGTLASPDYESVKTGLTGHAEAVRVEFNPADVSFDELLDHFFRCHNPTQLNRQGPDSGSQYRSHIFCLNDTQVEKARLKIKSLSDSGRFDNTIKTLVSGPGDTWYPAESYHQKYFLKNPGQCHFSS